MIDQQPILRTILADCILPATVVLLKLFLRLYAGQSANKVDFAKVALTFPMDLAFLAISFSAIFLGFMQTRITQPLPTRAVLGIFLLYVLAAGLVTVLVKKSDGAFVVDRHWVSVAWTLPAYLISLLAIFLSILPWGG
jgi:hypothetical protein